jgi:fluoroquinolone transport system permease protein
MTLITFIKNDLKLFWRNGIIPAYGFMFVCFACSLVFSPFEYREYILSAVLCMDTAAIGFFFAGGIIMLEKNQNVFSALFSTPLGIPFFILGRTLSLSIITLIMALSLILSAGTPLPDAVLKLSGTLLANVLYCFFGIATGFSARSLNGYFGLSFVLLFPLIAFGFIFRALGMISTALLLLPIETQLYFCADFFYNKHNIPQTLLALISLVVWISLAGYFAYKRIKIFQSGKTS